VDERILASIIMGQRLKSIRRSTTGHKIPASAEFILEGSVTAGDLSQEGPFGDHLGHYSHSAQFPVYRVKRFLARQDAIYPATVVGKPPQEDYFIGEALQDLSIPILKIIKPGISDLWAYPETGFHPLAVLAVRERYHREALKHALSMLGEGQVSLTKVLMVVDASVNVRDFKQVSRALWQHLDADGVHLLVPTAQDTLDFTGPAMNSGSRLILLATGESDRPLRCSKPSFEEMPSPTAIHDQILGLKPLGEAILVVQTAMRDAITDVTNDMAQALAVHPATRDYLFQVLVSPDVPLDDPRLILWGWFTRFDPATDLHPARRELQGNRLILHFPILIDARWKTGYRQPVAFDPDKKRYVDQRWKEYGFPF
jgi:3-polyprenyl-4-hydroxybenzoate decarboxylase